jgi:hypothetical protein
MKPDTGYEAATDATEKSKLEAVKASMTQQVLHLIALSSINIISEHLVLSSATAAYVGATVAHCCCTSAAANELCVHCMLLCRAQ